MGPTLDGLGDMRYHSPVPPVPLDSVDPSQFADDEEWNRFRDSINSRAAQHKILGQAPVSEMAHDAPSSRCGQGMAPMGQTVGLPPRSPLRERSPDLRGQRSAQASPTRGRAPG